MRIIGIETSCDETSVSVINAKGGINNQNFTILSNITYSQIKIHEKYGGVFPALAKREHSKKLVPVFLRSLKKAGALQKKNSSIDKKVLEKVQKITEREPELFSDIERMVSKFKKPEVDALAVTYGPGLEPALWVGINFAKALSEIWQIPIIPVNHMEGHIASVLLKDKIKFPAVSLLISGGHTEIVLIEKGMKYKILGQTLDDAVGEAYDKTARMLSLPYPGGPQISKLSEIDRKKRKVADEYKLPRPMIHSNNLDFSFSGLKTAVLYTLKKIPEITADIQEKISREFEDSVVDVLTSKTKQAIENNGAKTLIIGGGVSANQRIRKSFKKLSQEMNIELLLPEKSLTTDNAGMISMAGFIKALKNRDILSKKTEIKAQGNLRLD